jgi:hypothetical protein
MMWFGREGAQGMAQNVDPRWWQWLQGIDPPTGQVRQQMFDAAIEQGDHARARMFVEQFEQARTNGMLLYGSFRRRYTPSDNKPVYTRPQILQLYAQHRRGAYTGREAEWARIENDIIAASREGRVANAVPLAKNFGDGR